MTEFIQKKTVLYVGLEPPALAVEAVNHVHCPLIQIQPRPYVDHEIAATFSRIGEYTHFVFTSKSAVRIFFAYLPLFQDVETCLKGKTFFAVGKGTARELHKHGSENIFTAAQETAEGVVALLEKMNLEHALLFWPHAAGARKILSHFLEEKKIAFEECILYDTKGILPEVLPDLTTIDEIHFSSPSTIDAFLELFGEIPADKTITCIGPITEAYLSTCSRIENKK